MPSTSEYYLYRHIRLDKNEPFYIGIGTKPKIYKTYSQEYHRAYVKDRNRQWKEVIKDTKFIVEIIFESTDVNEIVRKEIEFIKLYGRKDLKSGSLCNLTSGGEGITGVSDEIKELISISKKGKTSNRKGCKLSEETKNKIRQANLGKKLSKETCTKMSQIKKGITPSDNCKISVINSNINRKWTIESKEKLSKSLIGKVPWNKGIKMQEETKQKISIKNKGRVVSEETRIKISTTIKNKNNINA